MPSKGASFSNLETIRRRIKRLISFGAKKLKNESLDSFLRRSRFSHQNDKFSFTDCSGRKMQIAAVAVGFCNKLLQNESISGLIKPFLAKLPLRKSNLILISRKIYIRRQQHNSNIFSAQHHQQQHFFAFDNSSNINNDNTIFDNNSNNNIFCSTTRATSTTTPPSTTTTLFFTLDSTGNILGRNLLLTIF